MMNKEGSTKIHGPRGKDSCAGRVHISYIVNIHYFFFKIFFYTLKHDLDNLSAWTLRKGLPVQTN